MACKPYYSTNSSTGRGCHATNAPSFPRPPAPPQPGLLPLPPQYSSFQPASRLPAPRASKKPRRHDGAAPAGASAPIAVAEPSKKRMAPASGLEEEWTETAADSLYSVSPPPSSVPMPTSLLLTVTAARTKAPTACAVEVAGVDVGATDELRRILRL